MGEKKYGLMAQFMKDFFFEGNKKGKDVINGKMEDLIPGNGKIIKCTGMENLFGMMEKFIEEIMYKTKKTDMEFSSGPMEQNMKDIGKMEKKMAVEYIMNPILVNNGGLNVRMG